MKLEGTVLVGTLLGTVVTVLVAWTKFRYKIGSPSFSTKTGRFVGKPSEKVSYLNLGDL